MLRNLASGVSLRAFIYDTPYLRIDVLHTASPLLRWPPIHHPPQPGQHLLKKYLNCTLLPLIGLTHAHIRDLSMVDNYIAVAVTGALLVNCWGGRFDSDVWPPLSSSVVRIHDHNRGRNKGGVAEKSHGDFSAHDIYAMGHGPFGSHPMGCGFA